MNDRGAAAGEVTAAAQISQVLSAARLACIRGLPCEPRGCLEIRTESQVASRGTRPSCRAMLGKGLTGRLWQVLFALVLLGQLAAVDFGICPEGWVVPVASSRCAVRQNQNIVLRYAQATQTPVLTSSAPAGITVGTITDPNAGTGDITIGVAEPAPGAYVLTFRGQAVPAPTASVTLVVRRQSGTDSAPQLTLSSPAGLSGPPNGSDLLVEANPGGAAVAINWSVADVAASAQLLPVLAEIQCEVFTGFKAFVAIDTTLPFYPGWDGVGANLPATANLTITAQHIVIPVPGASATNGNIFGVRWKGMLVGSGEISRFQLRADDGVRIYAGSVDDGKSLPLTGQPDGSDPWSVHDANLPLNSEAVSFGAGVAVPFRVDYFQGTGGESCVVQQTASRTASSFFDLPEDSLVRDRTTALQTCFDGATVQTAQVGPVTATTVGGTIALGLPASQARTFAFRSVDPDGFASAVHRVTVRPNSRPTVSYLRLGSASGNSVNDGDSVVCNPNTTVQFFYGISDDPGIGVNNTLAVKCISVTPGAAAALVTKPADSLNNTSSTGSFSIGLLDTTSYTGGPIEVRMDFQDGLGLGLAASRRIVIIPNNAPKGSYKAGADQVLATTTFALDALVEDQNNGTAANRDIVLKDTRDWQWPSSALVVTADATSAVLPGDVFSEYSAAIYSIDNSSSEKRAVLRFSFKTKPNQNTAGVVAKMNVVVVDGDGLSSTVKVAIEIQPGNDKCALSFGAGLPDLAIPADAGFTPVIPVSPAAGGLTIADTLDGRVGDPADGRVGNPPVAPTGVTPTKPMLVEMRVVLGTVDNSPLFGETILLQGGGGLTVSAGNIKSGATIIGTWEQPNTNTVLIKPSVTATLQECLDMLGLVRYGWMLGTPPNGLPARRVTITVTEPGYPSSVPANDNSNPIPRPFTLMSGVATPYLSARDIVVPPLGRVQLSLDSGNFAPGRTVVLSVPLQPRSGRIETFDGAPVPASGVPIGALYYRNTSDDVVSDSFQLAASDGSTTATTDLVRVTIAYTLDAFVVVGDPVIDLVSAAGPPPTWSGSRTFVASEAPTAAAFVDYPDGTTWTPPAGWTIPPPVRSGNTIACSLTWTGAGTSDTAPPWWTHIGLRVDGGTGKQCIIPLSLRGPAAVTAGVPAANQ